VRLQSAVFSILGFSLAVATCWLTEVFDPPFSFTQVSIETLVIGIVSFFTLRAMVGLIGRIESATIELRQRHVELQKQVAQLEASRKKLMELDELKCAVSPSQLLL
jgi:hypothetical protein